MGPQGANSWIIKVERLFITVTEKELSYGSSQFGPEKVAGVLYQVTGVPCLLVPE